MIRNGKDIANGTVISTQVCVIGSGPAGITAAWYLQKAGVKVTLIEGRNRQIRKMFEAVGHHAEKIKRVRYGPLALDVDVGKHRSLTEREVRALHSAVGGHKKSA